MEGVYPGGDDEPLIYALKGRRIYGWDRVMLCGHTHKRLVRTVGTLTDKLTIINAGTLRRDNEPCFSVVDFEIGRGAVLQSRPGRRMRLRTAEKLPLLGV